IDDSLEAKIRSEILFKKRTEQAKWALLLASILGLVALGSAGRWWLHRRRSPWAEKALAAFNEREQSVRLETDQIDTLFTRNAEILGSLKKVEERGYTGITRMVSEQALKYVDDLFIMSKEVNRVVGEAKALIYPTSLWGQLSNLFSSRNYEKAVELLSGKPLRFSKREGLPWVLRDSLAEQQGLAKPLDESQIPEEISLTFEEVYQAFKDRGVQALQALTTIETSLTTVHDKLTALQQELEVLTTREKALNNQSQQDGFFPLDNAVEVLLPSIQSDLAKADELAGFDAVQAVQESLPTAERKLRDFDRLVDEVEVARQELFPRLQDLQSRLKGMSYAAPWIDATLKAISQLADDSVAEATGTSIEPRIE
ncbi:MAG: hypothetical protein ACK53L_14500, partial [Pirellulaceae bacterium]